MPQASGRGLGVLDTMQQAQVVALTVLSVLAAVVLFLSFCGLLTAGRSQIFACFPGASSQ